MAFDSSVRLRQLNQSDLSGFIIPIIQSYLTQTGNLTGSFYPLNQNPAGYEGSGAFLSQQDLDSAILQTLNSIYGIFYPTYNPSGFITTGQATGQLEVVYNTNGNFVIQFMSGLVSGSDIIFSGVDSNPTLSFHNQTSSNGNILQWFGQPGYSGYINCSGLLFINGVNITASGGGGSSDPLYVNNIYDKSSINSISVSGGVILAGNDMFTDQSIDWVNRFLYDNSSLESVDWSNRLLEDNLANDSLNWQNRQLIDGSGIGQVSCDWTNRFLIDNLGETSADWANRWLVTNTLGGNNNSLDWQNRCLINNSQANSLDWQNHILSGTWTGNGNLLISGNVYSNNHLIPNITQTVSGNLTGLYLPPSTISGNSINTTISWQSGDHFFITLTGNTSITFTGTQDAMTVVIGSYDTGSGYTISFPTGSGNNFSGIKWPGGTGSIPTQTSGFTDVYTFTQFNKIIYCSYVQNF